MIGQIQIEDLASKEYWNKIYSSEKKDENYDCYPKNYNSRVIGYHLFKCLDKYNPKNVLEIGCGDSRWLPLIANKANIKISGIDYSEIGCKKLIHTLHMLGVEATIYNFDVFSNEANNIGQYEFVYSLGFVEHFTNLKNTIDKLSNYVMKNGILFTEIPNMRSIHGLMSKLWHPVVYYKHNAISRQELISAYKFNGYKILYEGYIGLFSFNLISWELYPRSTVLAKVILPILNIMTRIGEKILLRTNCYDVGLKLFSPFYCIIGVKEK